MSFLPHLSLAKSCFCLSPIDKAAKNKLPVLHKILRGHLQQTLIARLTSMVSLRLAPAAIPVPLFRFFLPSQCPPISLTPAARIAPAAQILSRSSSSSTRWKSRQGRDSYAKEAKVQGLKSRAAFKLLEVRCGDIRKGNGGADSTRLMRNTRSSRKAKRSLIWSALSFRFLHGQEN